MAEVKRQLKSHGSMIFIIPEETKLITRCFQFQCVNVHHNLMYAVISATRKFDVQCKYVIVKSCNYSSVDGSHLFTLHQVSHCWILVWTIYSKMYHDAISLPDTY